MSVLLSKIGQLAVFLICAQTLVHFRPKNSYEKYIKLLVSMMLLILLVEPVMDLLGKGNKGDFLERVHVYEQELQDILISPQLETAQIEVILQNITKQKVEEGAIYVQEKESEDVQQPVSSMSAEEGTRQHADSISGGAESGQLVEGMSGEGNVGQDFSNVHRTEENTEAIEVQVKIEEVKEVRIGANYGESANNH